MFRDTPECFRTLPGTDRQTALLDEKLGLHVAGRGQKNFGELVTDTLNCRDDGPQVPVQVYLRLLLKECVKRHDMHIYRHQHVISVQSVTYDKL